MEKKLVVNGIGGIQGDVPILRITSIPEGAKLTKQRVVAYGESTGHHHQVVGEVEAYEVARGLVFVVAEGHTAELQHTGGEHYTIEMTPGIYFIPAPGYQQVEYTGENERRVVD